MTQILSILLISVLILVVNSAEENIHRIHSVFGDLYKPDIVYYGYIDVDEGEYRIINELSVNDIGNPRNRRYEQLPLGFDPSNDILYLAARDNRNQTILSVINATTGAFLKKFNSISNEIISLQYDIFNKKLFAHVQTDDDNSTKIVEIDTQNGTFKNVLAEISQAKATDLSTYCPICRKYFLVMYENDHFTYVAVNTTDDGGISWRIPLNFSPLNIRFTYKTFTMYSSYINQTDRALSQIGILNRTTGSITQIVGTISNQTDLSPSRFSAFDVANALYYTAFTVNDPFHRGIAFVNVNTSQTDRTYLSESNYSCYAWFIKQFVQ